MTAIHPTSLLYILLALGGLVACDGGEVVLDDDGIPADAPDVCEGCNACEIAYLPSDERQHVDGGVVYPDTPPASGNHDPCWAEWGAHTTALEDENWLHNLEHGGVVFLYNCPEGCDTEVNELTAFAATLPENTWIVTPYSEMERSFAAVAWNYRTTTDCLDVDSWQAFYDYFADNAPESVTSMPSASCLE